MLRAGSVGCILPKYKDEVQKLLVAGEDDAANEAYGNVCARSREELMVIVLDEFESDSVYAKSLVIIDGRRLWVFQVSLTCCYVPM